MTTIEPLTDAEHTRIERMRRNAAARKLCNDMTGTYNQLSPAQRSVVLAGVFLELAHDAELSARFDSLVLAAQGRFNTHRRTA
jgi:hypothetical protein